MNKYYDYFPQKPHVDGEVSLDEFIAEAMRTDLKFSTTDSELQYLRTSKVTLMNELLTVYQYLKENNRLSSYEAYKIGK